MVDVGSNHSATQGQAPWLAAPNNNSVSLNGLGGSSLLTTSSPKLPSFSTLGTVADSVAGIDTFHTVAQQDEAPLLSSSNDNKNNSNNALPFANNTLNGAGSSTTSPPFAAPFLTASSPPLSALSTLGVGGGTDSVTDVGSSRMAPQQAQAPLIFSNNNSSNEENNNNNSFNELSASTSSPPFGGFPAPFLTASNRQLSSLPSAESAADVGSNNSGSLAPWLTNNNNLSGSGFRNFPSGSFG